MEEPVAGADGGVEEEEHVQGFRREPFMGSSDAPPKDYIIVCRIDLLSGVFLIILVPPFCYL